MHMDVEDRLAGVWPGVHDGAVAGLVDLLFLSDLPGNEREMSKYVLVFQCHFINGADMLFWNDENMHGRFGVDVFEGKARVILKRNPGRNLFLDEFAKQTIGHDPSLESTPRRIECIGGGLSLLS